MSRRASRPGRPRPLAPRVDVAEVLGLLIDPPATEDERDIIGTISEVLARDEELGRDMLRLVQVMRDTGALTEKEACHLLYWIADQMSFGWSSTDPELSRLTAAMEAAERRHGLSEDEYFLLDDAPEEWSALNREWERRLDAIWADEFTRLGELELARLARTGLLHEDPRIDEGRLSLRARRRMGEPDSMFLPPV